MPGQTRCRRPPAKPVAPENMSTTHTKTTYVHDTYHRCSYPRIIGYYWIQGIGVLRLARAMCHVAWISARHLDKAKDHNSKMEHQQFTDVHATIIPEAWRLQEGSRLPYYCRLHGYGYSYDTATATAKTSQQANQFSHSSGTGKNRTSLTCASYQLYGRQMH